MTTSSVPGPGPAVIRQRVQRPAHNERTARVRPYHRHQEHRPSRQARVVRPAAPMRDRAVLERVLVGLRALDTRPATPPAVQSTAQRRPHLSLVVGDSAATTTSTPSTQVAVSAGEALPAPPVREATVRSLLGRELMPLVRAVLARRPEAAVPAERVEPSPDSIRTQPLGVVEVGV